MSIERYSLSEVHFIKRIVVGNDHPTNMRTEAEVEESMALVNRCLQGTPRGHIVGVEKNFGLYTIGEHQVVLQYVVYNIGFHRKPMFLD